MAGKSTTGGKGQCGRGGGRGDTYFGGLVVFLALVVPRWWCWRWDSCQMVFDVRCWEKRRREEDGTETNKI